jgi:hypothetical protein
MKGKVRSHNRKCQTKFRPVLIKPLCAYSENVRLLSAAEAGQVSMPIMVTKLVTVGLCDYSTQLARATVNHND